MFATNILDIVAVGLVLIIAVATLVVAVVLAKAFKVLVDHWRTHQ